MRIVFPQNIFSKILSFALPEEFRRNISFQDVSLISRELEKGNADLALVPSCDLVKHPELFISKKIAISFDGQLSSSYLYFVPGQNSFTDLFLSGEVSANEIILSKILFAERYSSDINVHLETGKPDDQKNCLISGNVNFSQGKFLRGLSFADELSTMIFLPYVNFIIVSREERMIEAFNKSISNIDKWVDDNVDAIIEKLQLELPTVNFIKENFNSVYFEMTENEIDSLSELIRLPFYHGIVDELIDLKLV
ncbi:MAG: hypothetical protein NTX22_02670 [Ignavibacteriales bacterium]|nr:hypothetical protein [Ignavibacteriales bacterium]